MIPNGTIDDAYFEWLYGLVASVTNRNPARSYWSLLRQMYSKSFQWFIPNDDNRLEDGRALRQQFLDEYAYGYVDEDWMLLECSFLELLIGVARRGSYQTDEAPSSWFWKLMNNLEVRDYSDKNYSKTVALIVEGVMNTVISRTYDADGRGGLFPLSDAERDQREIEIWYQMSAYLLEGG